MGLVKSASVKPGGTYSVRADLTSSDANERRAAVEHLASRPGSEEELCRQLAQESDRSVRERILLALVGLGTVEAAEGLAELLTDEDPALRNGALESLSAMPDQAELLLDQLNGSADPDVRIFGLLLAADLPRARAQQWIARYLDDEEDANVCAAAAECLAQIGDEDAVAPLERLRKRFEHEPFVEFVCSAALAQLGAHA